MKKIEAIIRKNKLDSVNAELQSIGIKGMTLTEVSGLGEEQGGEFCYRGVAARMKFVPRVKLEIIVADIKADAVIDAIFQAAHTGKFGDGRIYVSQLESVVKIRTGEVEDSNAIDASEQREHQSVLPEKRAVMPSTSADWFGPRTFSGFDSAAMDYWSNH
jgi:nitrogen regulatory protein P-II 1